MARRYDPNGPHPRGFTLEDVPVWVNLSFHPKRVLFEADPSEGKAKTTDYVVDPYVYKNWHSMVKKFKTFMAMGITDGFPVLLDGESIGLNEAGRRLGRHPATLRRKLEQGIVEVRGHTLYPDEVVLDFCYEQVQASRIKKRKCEDERC